MVDGSTAAISHLEAASNTRPAQSSSPSGIEDGPVTGVLLSLTSGAPLTVVESSGALVFGSLTLEPGQQTVVEGVTISDQSSEIVVAGTTLALSAIFSPTATLQATSAASNTKQTSNGLSLSAATPTASSGNTQPSSTVSSTSSKGKRLVPGYLYLAICIGLLMGAS